MAEAGGEVIKTKYQYYGGNPPKLATMVYEAMEALRISPQTAGRDLVEENARLREALKPFAEWARVTRSDSLGYAGWRDDRVFDVATGSYGGHAEVVAGDFRRAMEALELPVRLASR
jgi:hypothetical protein